jgi:hypothetical protein
MLYCNMCDVTLQYLGANFSANVHPINSELYTTVDTVFHTWI